MVNKHSDAVLNS